MAALFTLGSDSVIRFMVRVTPKASRERIDGMVIDSDGVPLLRVAVTEVPEGGKANKAVLAMLAKELGVAKTQLTVQTGAAERRKLLCLKGDATELARLNKWASSLKP
jgi:uncharacterized protein YggU (UPF0235/DUF167 family)